MKEVFIINPKSGKGKTLKFAQTLEKKENREIFIPNTQLETTLCARKYAFNEDPMVIYAVGGDGTLNAVLNGMIGSKAILGLVPMGSGNDFARTLNELGVNGPISVDVGVMNDECFINIASIGFDANVIANLEEKRGKRKFLTYPRAILDELLKKQSFQTIETNESLSKITLLAVCNGRYYGNGIEIAPSAILNDGKLNVYKANEITKLQLMKLFLQVLKHTHENNPLVIKEMIKHLDFTAIEPDAITANLDGEMRSYHKFNFSIIRNGITVTNDIPDDVKSLMFKMERR